MPVLVVGGTGTVGSQVVEGLVNRGAQVRVITRSQQKADSQPAGAAGVVADLSDPSSLPAAFDGVEGMFLLTALGPNETAEGLAAVDAARAAGVERIVFMTVHKLHDALHIPHFGSKVPIENAIKQSGIPYTFLQPNNFFQNDVWSKEAIVSHSIYPQPIGDVGLSRVDVRDIADAAVNALTGSGHEGKAYPVVGPDAMNGRQVAEVYSRHLGREVRYAGNDLGAWAEQAKTMLPEWMVHDLRIMFEYFMEQGLVATAEDLAQQQKVLGHEPRSFDAFVAELVPAWMG